MRRSLPQVFAFTVLGCSATPQPEPGGPHGHDAGHHHPSAAHGFKDAASWSREFDDPARDAWQKPDEVVSLLGISAGMIVADVGAGTGYFEGRLAAAVGAQGKVFALDVEPEMVAFMKARFERDALATVEARACPFDGTGLAAASVDRVLIVDTWHHVEGREAYAKHLAGVLRPGGSVTIVDFTLDSPKGPPPGHRVGPEVAVRELASAGLHARVVDETLPDQYVVVATRD